MKENKRFILLIIMILIALLVTALSFNNKINKSYYVTNGYLDLTDYDINKGPIRLVGEWQLYKNKFLTLKQIEEGIYYPELSQVPGSFKNPSSDNECFGYGTYRLRIKTKNIKSVLALKVLTMSTSYKIYVNNELLGQNGIVSSDKETFKSQYLPQVLIWSNESEYIDILVHVSNYTYNRIGMWHALELGTYKDIIHYKLKATIRSLILVGGIVFLLFYHLGIMYLQHKNNKENFYLIISLIIMLLRILSTGEYLISSIFPSISVSTIARIEYLSIVWAAAIIMLFTAKLFKNDVNKRIILLNNVAALFLSALILILPAYIFTAHLYVIEIYYIAVFMYLVYFAALAIIRERPFAILCLTGYVIALIAAIVDVLYFLNIITVIEGGITPYSVFYIIAIQIFVIARRYEKSFDDVRNLSIELIKQNKIKDDFLNYTSQEMKTPLNEIIGLIEHTIQDGSNLLEQQYQNLVFASRSSNRLYSLVNNILDYSKLKNQDIKISKQVVPLKTMFSFVIDTYNYLAEDYDTKIVLNISEGINVLADKERLIQIIRNLFISAVRYTKQGTIFIDSFVRKNKVEIVIRNDKPVTPYNKLQDMIDAFLNQSDNEASLTDGLRLNISMQLIKLHGGRIWTSSDYSGSSINFTLETSSKTDFIENTLRFKRQKSKTVNAYHQLKIYGKPVAGTLLIVDSDSSNIKHLLNILSEEEYQLLATTSGEVALKAIENYQIDLILIDTLTHGYSGYKLCEIIRRKYTLSQIPIMLLTTQTSTESILYGFSKGINDFLAKPYSSEELKARVSTLVKMKKSALAAINNEAAFLQAQIKPHFIYNALNVIISLCDTDPERASDLLLEFSNYLRKSFDFSNVNNLIPLESEIEYVKSYIFIEQARFENKIKCHINVNVDLTLMIPPLILQPIVENSIKHGILKKKGIGNIYIDINGVLDKTIITVRDDGIGIDEEKLSDILKHDEGRSIGLKNINKRLMYYYGSSLSIKNDAESGCIVTVVLPNKERTLNHEGANY